MSVEATTIVLVRHAAHERLDHVLCGRMPDVRLGPRGHAQAASLAERLARDPLAAIYSSPRERACETAEPIAARFGLAVMEADGIDEIDCGAWTGLRFDVLQADPRWHRWNSARETGAAPGGETMADVRDRAMRALATWREAHPGGVVAAVSHADVIKAAICGVLGLSLDRHHAFEIAPASRTTLVLWNGGGKVVCLNESAGDPAE